MAAWVLTVFSDRGELRIGVAYVSRLAANYCKPI
jgi:hypothetical protein